MAKKSAPAYRRYVCDICYRKRMLKEGTHYCDCYPGGTRMTDCANIKLIQGLTRLIGYPPESE